MSMYGCSFSLAVKRAYTSPSPSLLTMAVKQKTVSEDNVNKAPKQVELVREDVRLISRGSESGWRELDRARVDGALDIATDPVPSIDPACPNCIIGHSGWAYGARRLGARETCR